MAETLDSLNSEKSRLERDIDSRKASNQVLRDQIKQLQNAYDRLGRIKNNDPDNANLIKKKVKLDNVAGSVEWKGQSKTDFDNIIKNDVKQAASDYYKSIDRIQDEIGRALDKKRGDLDTGIGILNGLNRSWNDVVGRIRNFFN